MKENIKKIQDSLCENVSNCFESLFHFLNPILMVCAMAFIIIGFTGIFSSPIIVGLNRFNIINVDITSPIPYSIPGVVVFTIVFVVGLFNTFKEYKQDKVNKNLKHKESI